MLAARGADDTPWCNSEQTLLLSQTDSPTNKYRLPLLPASYSPSHRPVMPAVLHFPTRLCSCVGASVRIWHVPVVRRQWLLSLLLAALLAAVLLYPHIVTDPHARWQLLSVQLVSATKLLAAVQAELTWDATLLLSFGSRLQACQLDGTAGGERDTLGLDRLSGPFSDDFLSESADGRSYELSAAAPALFSPSYRPSTSSPYRPPSTLACSKSSLRCDVAVVDLFQADLQAESEHPATAHTATPHSTDTFDSDSASAIPTFCTSPQSNDQCEQWPFSDSSSDGVAGEQRECGSGVLDMQESEHWWYYRHPMSCMRLARSIASSHSYCVGHIRDVDESVVNFHVAMFGPLWRRQATLAVSSFLLTQNLNQSRLLVWTDRPWSELSGVGGMQPLLDAAAQHVELRVWNAYEELVASNSLLSGSAAWYASIDDSHGYLRGDLMRLLLLHNYGGVWLDADVLLLRDLSPFLGQQFLYKWGGHCDELNGAVVRMFRGSALSSRFLDAIYHTPPRPNSVDWGNSLYSAVHAEQQASRTEQGGQSTAQPSVTSLRSDRFTVFPACFFNPNWMEPGAFSPILRPELPTLWPSLWYGPFAYHLHGEVWDDDGYAARDPTYLHVAAAITLRIRALWKVNLDQHSGGAAAG